MKKMSDLEYRNIYKYHIDYDSVEQQIPMPEGAKLLCVDHIDGEPYLFAEVIPEKDIERRDFFSVPTGHPLPPPVDERYGLDYIGSFKIHLKEREMVFHLYESVLKANNPDI